MGLSRWNGLRSALSLFVLLLLLPILPATLVGAAATITVTSNADMGAGTLRQAVADIDAGGTITFTPGLGTITLASGLDITKAMTITGNGPSATIIQGGPDPLPPGNSQVWLFTVHAASGTVAFTALTVRNYYSGILAESLTAVTNVTFSGFSYVGFYNIADTVGQATVTGSTFTGNEFGMDQKTGGLKGTGASLSVSNTTFSGNVTGLTILSLSTQPSSVTVTSSTFTDNGTGLDNAPINPHPLTITSSIVAGNSTNCRTDAPATITDGGYNLEYGTGTPANTCPFVANAVHADPVLGPLADNGGPTRTHALGAGSPAINAGGIIGTTCPTTDQRGVTRTGQCDIGAYEFVTATRFVVSGYPSPDTAGQIHPVTATDAQGNVATAYSGTVTVTTSDPQATVEAAHLLTNGVGTFTVIFKTGGTQSITATGPAPSGGGMITGSQTGIVVIATPTSKDQCKGGGWQQLTDASGQPFRNQGECASYFNHQ